MIPIRVKILHDAEDAQQKWWLAHVEFGGQPHVTQGKTVDEARFMAADLLATLGAPHQTPIEFDVADEKVTVGDVLGSVTPMPSA